MRESNGFSINDVCSILVCFLAGLPEFHLEILLTVITVVVFVL